MSANNDIFAKTASTMKNSDKLSKRIETDLGLDVPFVKGERIPVSDCWHFCTDGNAVDSMFRDEQDFIDGMNRIYFVSRRFDIRILAHALMDTHLHFVLYGSLSECTAFVQEYVRRTSMHIENRHGLKKRLKNIPVNCQRIDNDLYLKTALCYVIKNPTAAGLRFSPTDYPWSSGALYFRSQGLWTSPVWTYGQYFSHGLSDKSFRERAALMKTKSPDVDSVLTSDKLIFPGEYIEAGLVERIFRTCRNFYYFLGISREEDLNPLTTVASRMTIPIQEMRQHRNELLQELFGVTNGNKLDMIQRLKLARALRSRYRSSPKQIAKVCGLVYEEVKGQLE